MITPVITAPARHLGRPAAWLTALALAGCAAPPLPQGGEAQLLEDVKAGKVQLDCGVSCSATYFFTAQTIWGHYQQRNWPALAVATARTGFRRDLTYYFLGAAAEGMQAWAAADRYYRMAGALATSNDINNKCSSVQNMCGSLVFPRDISNRLRAVAQHLPAQQADNNAQRRAPGVPPPSPGLEPIPDAPQALLAQYAATRLYGLAGQNPQRDQEFASQLLEVLDPAAAQDTRGNEIARPKAIAAMKDRLGNQVAESRVVLGTWVQLRAYDLGTHSFELRYPLHTRNRLPQFGDGLYSANSNRQAGAQGYTARGSACVHDNLGNELSRPDEPESYFMLMSVCQQHPGPRDRHAGINAAGAEVPPFMLLVPPRDGLWPRLNVDEARADAMLRKMNANRMAWAELVLDVRSVAGVSDGPFDARDQAARRRPGMVVSVVPRALVVWETPPEPNRPGRVLAIAGDVNAQAAAQLSGRLPRNLVADRNYDGVPEPSLNLTGFANPTRPVAVRPAPAPTRPAPTAPAAPTKAKPASDDGDAWIDPRQPAVDTRCHAHCPADPPAPRQPLAGRLPEPGAGRARHGARHWHLAGRSQRVRPASAPTGGQSAG